MEDERANLLNSILKRGPNKRRIKPAENNDLLQLALCYEDGSEDDDEDFQMDSDDEDEGSFSEVDSDEEEKDKSRQSQGSEKQAEQANDDDDNDDDETSDSDDSSDSPSDKPATVEDMVKQLKDATPSIDVKTPEKHQVAKNQASKLKDSLKVLICGICLEDNNDEDDEIVECDNCGISVHESCYGINTDDDNSDDSSDSESSTEPWFCDACKSGVTPECELCPNLDGIFKETLRGQWVHLICALYTPGVTFDIPEKLEGVVLIDMPTSKWGAKECELCEDPNLCRTGVCIGCDAGLCKTFFHASCAQKKGLLSELPDENDEDVADPLYAHCKLHLDKSVAKKKRQTYLTYVSHVKKFKKTDVDKAHKSRVEESLQVAREVYRKQKEEKTPPPALKEKVARSILTCPSVFRHLLKKAELLGYVSQQSQMLSNTRRKWHIPVALTVEFVNYFYERGNRMKNMKTRLEELTSNNKKLQEQEQLLRSKYDELSQSSKDVTSQYETVKNKCFELHNLLCKLAEKEYELPKVLKEFEGKKDDVQRKDELRLSVCSKCEKTENQHLMVDCDTCHSYYHLACVDPPLTRMPKKSSTMLWQCTECDSSSSEEEDNKIDPNDKTSLLESRQKRNIKEPSKFTPGKDPNEKKKRTYKRLKKQPTAKPVKYRKVEEPKPRKVRVYRKKKQDNVKSTCATCGELGDNSNIVRCDECKNCFHYGCLDPPRQTNPKPKGYSWYCTDCDDTPEEDSEDEQTKEEENKDQVDAEQTIEQETSITDDTGREINDPIVID